jgi:hypothetical protein
MQFDQLARDICNARIGQHVALEQEDVSIRMLREPSAFKHHLRRD